MHDYKQARNILANPDQKLQENIKNNSGIDEQQSSDDKILDLNCQNENQEVSYDGSQKNLLTKNSKNRYLKIENQVKADIKKEQAENENDFSEIDSDSQKDENYPQKDAKLEEDRDPSVQQNASLNGPIFFIPEDQQNCSEQNQDPMKGGDGYISISKTHKKDDRRQFAYDEGEEASNIRKKLLTKEDARGQTLLHIAAQLGDKYFSTMIVNELEDIKCLDQIINSEDKEGRTPLYLLCESGFRRKDSKQYKLRKWTEKDDQEAPFQELEDHFYVNKENLDDNQQINHGLLFTLKKPMPDLIDKDREMECQQPSRILITKLFIDAGASISFQTEVTEMTPLHWLAYWGDY